MLRRPDGTLGIARDRILVEPNGVDLSFLFPRDRRLMREQYGIGGEDFVVVFVGANEDRKGPKRLLAALEGLSDAKCILAGVGT